MINENLKRILHRFEIAARAHFDALERMDADQAERQALLIAQLYRRIVGFGNEGRRELLALAQSPDRAVSGMAAVYSLRFRPEQALPVLRMLAGEDGLMGFRAAVAIQRWESGEWDID